LRHEITSIGKPGVQAIDELLDSISVASRDSAHPSRPGGGSGNAGAKRYNRHGLYHDSSY
jgi:hypothetical protein